MQGTGDDPQFMHVVEALHASDRVPFYDLIGSDPAFLRPRPARQYRGTGFEELPIFFTEPSIQQCTHVAPIDSALWLVF